MPFTLPTQEIINKNRNRNRNIDIDEWISIILPAIARMRMIRIFTYEYDTNEKYDSNYGCKRRIFIAFKFYYRKFMYIPDFFGTF